VPHHEVLVLCFVLCLAALVTQDHIETLGCLLEKSCFGDCPPPTDWTDYLLASVASHNIHNKNDDNNNDHSKIIKNI